MKGVCLRSSVQHVGGSIRVWVCITANVMGDSVRIVGKINAEKYRQILIHHAIPSGKHLVGNSFIFQQENDLKHTVLKAKFI